MCNFIYEIGALEEASCILRQLVNEQYNEVTNAQLLSTIYVYKYFDDKSNAKITSSYKLLANRVPAKYLFPMPDKKRSENKEELASGIYKSTKKRILLTKYKLSLMEFYKKI